MIVNYNLPYDYEVEYLHLDGGAYFDTGMLATDASCVKMKIKFDAQWDSTAIDYKKGVFGREDEPGKIFDVQCRAYYLVGYNNNWTPGGTGTFTDVKPNITTGDNIELNAGVLTINDVVLDTRAKNSTFTSTKTMYAFGVADGSTGKNLIGNVYTLQYYQNGSVGGAVPDIDWYPVMKGGQLGMYNKRTKTVTFPVLTATSVVTPGPVSHAHDDDFVEYQEFGGMLGRLPGSTKLLTGEDYGNIFFSVDYIPSATTSNYGAIILSKQYGDYLAGQMLKKISTASGGYIWTPINGPTVGTDAPYNVRAHRVGGRFMKIRWQDPDDKWNGKTLAQWKYTRVIRKLGSYPTGIHDGVVVADSSVRDFYNERILTDVLPLGVNGVWYYRLFAVSVDGVAVTGEKASFFPIDLEWSTLSSYIQSGYGPSILGVGDVIQLDNAPFESTDVNKVYNNLELVVAGFDLYPATLPKIRHTITFVSRFAPIEARFDRAWGDKYLVEDEIVVAGLKTYYWRSGSGTAADPYTYTVAKPQPKDGYHITAKDGYYLSTMDNRSKYGCNVWNKCSLHKWISTCKDHTYKLTKDTTVDTSKVYYKASANTDNCYYDIYEFASTSENPQALGLFEEESAITFDALDSAYYPPLKAIRLVDKEFSELIRSVKVKTGLGVAERIDETGYVEVDELCTVPSYTETTGLINYDVRAGEPFAYYTVDVNHRKYRKNASSATTIDWWTRSPVIPDYMDLTEDETFQNGTNYYTRSGAGTEKEPYIYTVGTPGIDYQIDDEIPENTWFVSVKSSLFTVRGIDTNGNIKDMSVSNTETLPTSFTKAGVVFVISIG